MTKAELDYILGTMLDSNRNVSDLNITADKPLQVESSGELVPVAIEPPVEKLTPFQTETISLNIINRNRRLTEDLLKTGSCDCSYSLGQKARFRVNIFTQRGHYTIILRKLSTDIPSVDQLNLPPVFHTISKEKTGLVLVTGATGSGKSTTLAALLNELNETKSIHIVTLEDPVEFVHPQKKATFNQREMGNDFSTFATGLRAALRQAPKVILVGEIRDRETMEIALTASETGHLVFTTLHTINAGQTITRILGMFSKDEEQQLRQRLAETLRYVVSQRLVSRTGGGRLLLTEIMGSSMRTREALLYGEGENRTFQEMIEAGSTLGWHSFDQSLLKAFEADLIAEDTAIIFCAHKHKMRKDIDMLKKLRGNAFEVPSGLRMTDPIKAAPTSIL